MPLRSRRDPYGLPSVAHIDLAFVKRRDPFGRHGDDGGLPHACLRARGQVLLAGKRCENFFGVAVFVCDRKWWMAGIAGIGIWGLVWWRGRGGCGKMGMWVRGSLRLRTRRNVTPPLKLYTPPIRFSALSPVSRRVFRRAERLPVNLPAILACCLRFVNTYPALWEPSEAPCKSESLPCLPAPAPSPP